MENSEGNCCLGVLCRLALKNGIKLNVRPYDDDGLICFNDEEGVPPEKVIQWAGLKTSNGKYSELTFDSTLANENDTGKTFAEIADIIEQNVEIL